MERGSWAADQRMGLKCSVTDICLVSVIVSFEHVVLYSRVILVPLWKQLINKKIEGTWRAISSFQSTCTPFVPFTLGEHVFALWFFFNVGDGWVGGWDVQWVVGLGGCMHTMQFTQSLTFSLTHSLLVSACPACGGTLGGLRHTSKLASASMLFYGSLSLARLKSMYLQGLVGHKQRVCLLKSLFFYIYIFCYKHWRLFEQNKCFVAVVTILWVKKAVIRCRSDRTGRVSGQTN